MSVACYDFGCRHLSCETNARRVAAMDWSDKAQVLAVLSLPATECWQEGGFALEFANKPLLLDKERRARGRASSM